MRHIDNGPRVPGFTTASDVVASTFCLMEVAEQELKGRDKPGLFMLLVPPTSMRGKDERVYRHHCRELITRFSTNQDPQLATKAEVLVALSDASLEAPPDAQHAALMDALFTEVMGRRVNFEVPIPEPWKGSNEELLAHLRSVLRVKGRKSP